MGDGHVADAQVIEHAQCAQAAVDRVAALQSDQTSHSTRTEGVHDACTRIVCRFILTRNDCVILKRVLMSINMVSRQNALYTCSTKN